MAKTFSFCVTVKFPEFSLIFGVFPKFPDWKNENSFSRFSLISRVAGNPVIIYVDDIFANHSISTHHHLTNIAKDVENKKRLSLLNSPLTWPCLSLSHNLSISIMKNYTKKVLCGNLDTCISNKESRTNIREAEQSCLPLSATTITKEMWLSC